jgi:hypothetical protein
MQVERRDASCRAGVEVGAAGVGVERRGPAVDAPRGENASRDEDKQGGEAEHGSVGQGAQGYVHLAATA